MPPMPPHYPYGSKQSWQQAVLTIVVALAIVSLVAWGTSAVIGDRTDDTSIATGDK